MCLKSPIQLLSQKSFPKTHLTEGWALGVPRPQSLLRRAGFWRATPTQSAQKGWLSVCHAHKACSEGPLAQAELKIVRLLPGPALCSTCPLHPPPLMDGPLQALHEVYTMQRQPWHQAPHPRAVSDSIAAEGSLHQAPEGPAQGHTGPASGPVSGSQGKPWEHQPAPISAEPGSWGICPLRRKNGPCCHRPELSSWQSLIWAHL